MNASRPKAVSLVGLPGSGKSTVGKQLARRLAFCFLDSDQLIEERIGCPIREYFETSGEQRFRDIEQEVIQSLLMGTHPAQLEQHCTGWVVSTGGGAVLREANRRVLAENSHVIYLRAKPEELYRRLRHDKTRPLLQVQDPLGRLRELYGQRDKLYAECASFVVETGRPTVQALANLIVNQLELAGVVVSGEQNLRMRGG